jgi:hypothetical protein
VFWVISVYFTIRTTLPKSGTLLLGHLYITIVTLPLLFSVFKNKGRRSGILNNYCPEYGLKCNVCEQLIRVEEFLICVKIQHILMLMSREYNNMGLRIQVFPRYASCMACCSPYACYCLFYEILGNLHRCQTLGRTGVCELMGGNVKNTKSKAVCIVISYRHSVLLI